MPVIVSAKELAARLDVSYETVLGWARRDEIPSIKAGNGRRYFNLNAVLAAMNRTQGRREAMSA